MGAVFWTRRFFLVFVFSGVVITGAHLLRGRTFGYSVSEGLIWALIAATVFTAARIFQSRRGQHCAICRDTPEMQRSAQD